MILAIDTSGMACSVALGNAEGVLLAQSLVNEGRFLHAERLLPMIDALLAEHKVERTALTAVACAGGPGSYTGLRIGASTAKAIAHAADIPMIAVDTCEVLAQGAIRRGEVVPGGQVFATLDARRMEVYAAGFAVTQAGGLSRNTETRAVVLQGEGEVAPEIAFPGHENGACFVGDGALKLADLLAGPGKSFVGAVPEARDVLTLGWAKWQAGDVVDLVYYEPAYLKEFAAALPKNPLGLGQLTRDRLPAHLRS